MSPSLKSPAFASREVPVSQPGCAPRAAAEARLWVALRLPELTLRAVTAAAEPRERPVAVVEPRRGRLFVVAADASARELGIEPGLGLGAAFGFSGSLEVLERSPSAEQAHLEALAASCGRLTPTVCIEPPDAVLLEVQASLRLFGGLASIKSQLLREARGRGFAAGLAAAPTPLGALWLVRGGSGDAFSFAQLQSRLHPLPLAVTHWPETVRTLLADMGVQTLGACLRLPRGGFARRTGAGCLQDLDRALGRVADPREAFAAPETLSFEAELTEETADFALLAEAIGHLTHELAEALRRRQAQVRRLELAFAHLRQAPTVLPAELVEAAYEELRFTALLCDKLERKSLPYPATAVRLAAGPLQPVRPVARKDLFDPRPGAPAAESPLRLVERLRGRLGPRTVYGLALEKDHRPEKAWGRVAEPRVPGAGASRAAGAPPSGAALPWPLPPRPLWLLRVPQRLGTAGKRPCFNGPLVLDAGPERIESGWWDGGDVAKDYFRAHNAGGQRVWIYLDRRRRDWYLHGFFA